MCGRAGRLPSYKMCSLTSFPWGCCCGFPCSAGSIWPPSTQAPAPLPLAVPISSPCSRLSVLLIVRGSKSRLAASGAFPWQLQPPHRQDSLWEVRGRSPSAGGSATPGCERRPCSPSNAGGKHTAFPRVSPRPPGLRVCSVGCLCVVSPRSSSTQSSFTPCLGEGSGPGVCCAGGVEPAHHLMRI